MLSDYFIFQSLSFLDFHKFSSEYMTYVKTAYLFQQKHIYYIMSYLNNYELTKKFHYFLIT